MTRRWLGLALLLLAVGAAADERAAILAERQALQARFAAQERECASRFVVNACLEDVRLRRREALEPLRERELQLDQAERLKRAEERRAAIAAKQNPAGAPRASAGPTPQLRVREPAPVPAARPGRASDEAERAAEAAARTREAEQRRTEAQAAQQRVQQRQAEREAAGKKSEPLPVAGAASAPKR
jgi:colicin import membrane protein